MVEVKVDLSKCNGDEVCVQICPTGVFEMKDGKAVVVDNDACVVCRACEVQCAEQAIEIIE